MSLFAETPFAEVPFAALGDETVVAQEFERDHEWASVSITYVPYVQGGEWGLEIASVLMAQDDIVFDPEFGYEIDGPFIGQEYPGIFRPRYVHGGRNQAHRRVEAKGASRRISALSQTE